MSGSPTILLLEDEALVLMGLQMAAQEKGCNALTALNSGDALALIESNPELAVAVLDVNLGGDSTCRPVACELRKRDIPFVLHSGALDHGHEEVKSSGIPFIAKPAIPNDVIDTALAQIDTRSDRGVA